ncbi:MAG: class I SAM-dependent methyltransferase [Chloroflexi bacterium]|nr:class I SAM-dependent methyltransferase [Chloroflexota bacterium]
MVPGKEWQVSQVDHRLTAVTRARYQRLSRFYDVMEARSEKRFSLWRRKLWEMARGPHILEVGVGTGKNMPYWPSDAQMTAIDLTPGMLEIAQRHAQTLDVSADLRVGDIQALDFPDASFNTVVGTFVFCSVPDAVLGLRELRRVLQPEGQVLLLEHVRSANRVLGALMDILNPLVVRVMGANINRHTAKNVRIAGLQIERVEDLDHVGIFKLIVARRGAQA